MQPVYAAAQMYGQPGITYLASFSSSAGSPYPMPHGQPALLTSAPSTQPIAQLGADADHTVALSAAPPCPHNNWDNLRAKHSVVTLCCRDCHAKWKQQFPIRNLCPEFHASLTCPLDVNCPFLHVHRFKSVTKSPTPSNHVTGGKQDPTIAAVAKEVLTQAPWLTPSAAHAEILRRIAAGELPKVHSATPTDQPAASVTLNDGDGTNDGPAPGLRSPPTQSQGSGAMHGTVDSPNASELWSGVSIEGRPPPFHSHHFVTSGNVAAYPQLVPAGAPSAIPVTFPLVLASAPPSSFQGSQQLVGFHPFPQYSQQGVAVSLPQSVYHPQQPMGMFTTGPQTDYSIQQQTHTGSVMFVTPLNAYSPAIHEGGHR